MQHHDQSHSKKPMGRPMGPDAKKAQKAIDDFLRRTTSHFSTKDIRRITQQPNATVRNRLNALLKAGVIERVACEKNYDNGAPKRGRPQAIYRVVTPPTQTH